MPRNRCDYCRVYGDLMNDLIARYIPHDEADKYRNAGWDVVPMEGHHGYHSMLATAPIEVASGAGSVVRFIAIRMGIPLARLLSSTRGRDVVIARQTGMWIARTATRESLTSIAYSFNRTDHTTVLNAIRRVRERRGRDNLYRAKSNELLAEFSERYAAQEIAA